MRSPTPKNNQPTNQSSRTKTTPQYKTPQTTPPPSKNRFPNVDKHVRKRLLASCFNFIPTTLTGQFLDSHDAPEGLMDVRRTFRYADPEVLAETTVPALAINGEGAGAETKSQEPSCVGLGVSACCVQRDTTQHNITQQHISQRKQKQHCQH